MPFQGACLCGQVKITLESAHEDQVACHCWDCKRTSGSAFSTNVVAPEKDITITGPIKTFDARGDSGNLVTRVFCGNCGSAISHKSPLFGEARAIQTGNFLAFSRIPFGAEIYVKDRSTGLAPIEGAGQIQGAP